VLYQLSYIPRNPLKGNAVDYTLGGFYLSKTQEVGAASENPD
jgi:hypothetical protein